jgi:vesicle coat complex subunit
LLLDFAIQTLFTISGGALYALAHMEKSHPKIFGDKLYNVIKKALIDDNKVMRRHALFAVREIPKLNNEFVPPKNYILTFEARQMA